jgi:hypothetical protein
MAEVPTWLSSLAKMYTSGVSACNASTRVLIAEPCLLASYQAWKDYCRHGGAIGPMDAYPDTSN